MEHQPLRPIEHGDGGGELVEGARVGFHLATEIGADFLELRQIRGEADGAHRGRYVDNFELAPLAGEDREHAATKRLPLAALLRGGIT